MTSRAQVWGRRVLISSKTPAMSLCDTLLADAHPELFRTNSYSSLTRSGAIERTRARLSGGRFPRCPTGAHRGQRTTQYLIDPIRPGGTVREGFRSRAITELNSRRPRPRSAISATRDESASRPVTSALVSPFRAGANVPR